MRFSGRVVATLVFLKMPSVDRADPNPPELDGAEWIFLFASTSSTESATGPRFCAELDSFVIADVVTLSVTVVDCLPESMSISLSWRLFIGSFDFEELEIVSLVLFMP